MRLTEMKTALNHPVIFTKVRLYIKNAKYILTGVVLRKDEKTGQLYYQAELTDPTTKNSVIYCKPEEITTNEESNRDQS